MIHDMNTESKPNHEKFPIPNLSSLLKYSQRIIFIMKSIQTTHFLNINNMIVRPSSEKNILTHPFQHIPGTSKDVDSTMTKYVLPPKGNSPTRPFSKIVGAHMRYNELKPAIRTLPEHRLCDTSEKKVDFICSLIFIWCI